MPATRVNNLAPRANSNWCPRRSQMLHCHAIETRHAHSSARSQHGHRSSTPLPLTGFYPDAEKARCHTFHISNVPSCHGWAVAHSLAIYKEYELDISPYVDDEVFT